MVDIFNEGISQTIVTVLANKDWRQSEQVKLLKKYPNSTLLSLKLNIPGPIKNNQYFIQLFTQGYQELVKSLNLAGHEIINRIEQVSKATGPEAILVVDTTSAELKKISINFEDNFKIGRIFDADVISRKQKQLSRTELGYQPRTCFLCGNNAKLCARSQKHSIIEIKKFLNKIYRDEIINYENKDNC